MMVWGTFTFSTYYMNMYVTVHLHCTLRALFPDSTLRNMIWALLSRFSPVFLPFCADCWSSNTWALLGVALTEVAAAFLFDGGAFNSVASLFLAWDFLAAGVFFAELTLAVEVLTELVVVLAWVFVASFLPLYSSSSSSSSPSSMASSSSSSYSSSSSSSSGSTGDSTTRGLRTRRFQRYRWWGGTLIKCA